jgi:hypothetical protein
LRVSSRSRRTAKLGGRTKIGIASATYDIVGLPPIVLKQEPAGAWSNA